MASRRTKSIGTKVTPEEYDRTQGLAGEQPISEWVRAALLKAAADPPTSDSVVLAELLALRTILLNRSAWTMRNRVCRRRTRSTAPPRTP